MVYGDNRPFFKKHYAQYVRHNGYEKQPGGGQARGPVAQIGFVEGEGGLAVEGIQDIAHRAGDEAPRTEGFPAAGRTVGEGEVFPIETDGNHAAGSGGLIEYSFAEPRF